MKKTIALFMLAIVLLSSAATFTEMNSLVKAASTPVSTSLAVSASITSGCTGGQITLTAALSGGSNPSASAIQWTTTSSTGTFGTPTTTSTTSTVTYVDTTAGSVTITANYPGNSNNLESSNTVSLTLYNLDFNGDGKVNFQDIVYFVQAYINCQISGVYNPLIDINHDGQVNFNDISLFVTLYDSYISPS